jgi:hypothetical protein
MTIPSKLVDGNFRITKKSSDSIWITAMQLEKGNQPTGYEN